MERMELGKARLNNFFLPSCSIPALFNPFWVGSVLSKEQKGLLRKFLSADINGWINHDIGINPPCAVTEV